MNTTTAVSRRTTNAPLSESPPLLVNLASGLFMLKGGLVAMAIATALILDLSLPPMAAVDRTGAWWIALLIVYAASHLWIGALLWRRSRIGGWLAAALIALPLAFGGLPSSTIGMVEFIVSAALILGIWRHLE